MNTFKRAYFWVYSIAIITIIVLFFVNDFALIDLHKTSVVMGIAIDSTSPESLEVTAQISVPTKTNNDTGSEGDFVEVSGEGATIAQALEGINAKTGFSLKLYFCKLILLGEGCKDRDIFELLDFFYRNNYADITAKVALCEGEAKKILQGKSAFGNDSYDGVLRILGSELKGAGKVSESNLKSVAQSQHSPSNMAYMPYISTSIGKEGEFDSSQTALFNNGKYVATLDEKQAFAFNLITSDIRFTVVTEDVDGISTSLGLKDVKGGVDLKIKDGKPSIEYSLSAKANLQAVNNQATIKELATNYVIPDDVLNGISKKIEAMGKSMIDKSIATDCDFLGLKEQCKRKYYNIYKEGLEDFLKELTYSFSIKLEETK